MVRESGIPATFAKAWTDGPSSVSGRIGFVRNQSRALSNAAAFDDGIERTSTCFLSIKFLIACTDGSLIVSAVNSISLLRRKSIAASIMGDFFLGRIEPRGNGTPATFAMDCTIGSLTLAPSGSFDRNQSIDSSTIFTFSSGVKGLRKLGLPASFAKLTIPQSLTSETLRSLFLIQSTISFIAEVFSFCEIGCFGNSKSARTVNSCNAGSSMSYDTGSLSLKN